MLGSRHYRFLSQSTDEETEALNTQYLICTPTTDKTCYNFIFRNGPTMICTPRHSNHHVDLSAWNWAGSLTHFWPIRVLQKRCSVTSQSHHKKPHGLPKALRTLLLGEVNHHITSSTTLTVTCCEETQASHMKRLGRKDKIPGWSLDMVAMPTEVPDI